MNIKYLIPFYKNYVMAMSRLSALEMAFGYVLKNPEYKMMKGHKMLSRYIFLQMS